MKTNLNELVVAIYARADMDREETGTSDIGVAASKIRNNIRQGLAVDPVEGVPAKYIPDFAYLHAYEINVGTDAFVHEWDSMRDAMRDNEIRLSQLWQAGDYTGMVRLMNSYEGDRQ